MIMTDKNNKIVVLKEYHNDFDANVDLGVLRSNGLCCELENEIVGGYNSIVGAIQSPIRLIVFSDDVDRANAILNSTL